MHRLVVAVVTLIGLTGAAFIAAYFLVLSAATDRAAALAPANSALYANIYLQPSTGQQMNLGGLIGRLPGFADDASLDEKVDQVVQNLLGGTGIDYRDQVKPWLGDQIALAAWPTDGDPTNPTGVIIAEVKDRAAAETAVADLASQGGAAFAPQTYQGVELQVAEGSAYAFVGEMLVLGQTASGIQSTRLDGSLPSEKPAPADDAASPAANGAWPLSRSPSGSATSAAAAVLTPDSSSAVSVASASPARSTYTDAR